MFSLCVTLMFSVRSEIVITGVGMNSLCNFTKYYSCEISLNVNFKRTNYAKFCRSPSLDGTMPGSVTSQENNSPLT